MSRKLSTWSMNTPFAFLKKKKCKKSVQKKLDSYFSPPLVSNPRTLQNIELSKTGALALAATLLCMKLSNINWCHSE